MKKACLTILCLFVFSAVGFASPLTDYSQGKVAVDLAVRPSSNLDIAGGDLDGSNSNFDGGLTFGLGNKFAFQWATQNSKSKDYSGTVTYGLNTATGSIHTDLNANQFNVLYQLDKNVSAFVGYTQAKNDVVANGTINGVAINGTAGGKTVNGWQVGLQGSTPLSDKVTGYGIVGVGSKINSFEAGISYAFAPNTELNVFYKNTKYKDLEFDAAPGKYDVQVDGLGVGVTFKF